MATLVLTTVGSAIGGPIGGAIGALIGNRIDGALLAPEGRRGPRLGDLSVQTSSYGAPIPKLFGRMRVAGTVIWATDLKETRSTGAGGKGRPRTSTYSYSASFAVALSGRPVRSIGRIWADGNLLRGAAGDWKQETGFRLHMGGEDQAVDPLIAATEGIAATPAHRGLAYAMFEDMALGPYGNRIPSLTFEVEADAAAPTIGAVAAVLSGGAVRDATATTIAGYAAAGDSVRGAIETLATAIPARLDDDGTDLWLGEADGAALLLPDDALGAAAGVRGGARREIERRAAGTLPDEVAIEYYDAARDYQAGLQRARRGGPGIRTRSIELPAVLAADEAKRIAERRLAEDWAGRREAVVRLPWRWLAIRPGSIVTIAGVPDRWRVTAATIDRMVTELRLAGVAGDPQVLPPAAAGRARGEADLVHGPTTLELIELPAIGDGVDTMPRLHAAAAGASAGWRRALLELSLDGGASFDPVGSTAAPATIGRVAAPIAAAGHALFDLTTVFDVELLHAGMTLEGRSDAALLAGANLALVGEELIQFGEAEQIGIRRYRLRRLLRGRRGTEARIGDHGADERFVLILPGTLAAVPLPVAAIGGAATLIATGAMDSSGVAATRIVEGLALRPPAPVHLTAHREPDGAVTIGWTRRSRQGWGWADGVDAPLAEEFERYRLTISGVDAAGGDVRTIECAVPHWRYDAAAQAADGRVWAAALAITVVQLGTFGPSPAAVARVVP